MEFMDKLAKVPLRYQPGERWMYSLSTDVCGALVEKISGQRFDKYLQEAIFEPLGMKDTAFFVRAGQGRPLRRQLPARRRQEPAADRRPGDQRLPQRADASSPAAAA